MQKHPGPVDWSNPPWTRVADTSYMVFLFGPGGDGEVTVFGTPVRGDSHAEAFLDLIGSGHVDISAVWSVLTVKGVDVRTLANPSFTASVSGNQVTLEGIPEELDAYAWTPADVRRTQDWFDSLPC